MSLKDDFEKWIDLPATEQELKLSVQFPTRGLQAQAYHAGSHRADELIKELVKGLEINHAHYHMIDEAINQYGMAPKADCPACRAIAKAKAFLEDK